MANVQAYPGDRITVDVSLNGVASGLQITLEYDPKEAVQELPRKLFTDRDEAICRSNAVLAYPELQCLE